MADRSARGEAARSRETDADRHRELTDRARERHDALSTAIERLERALAAPAALRAAAWSERASSGLDDVRQAIAAHVDQVEAPEGLLDEIRAATPRLAARVDALHGEHTRLLERAAALAGRLPGGDDLDFPALRRDAAGLLAELRAHRATEADLIYESFWTDLGAGD